GNPHDEFSTIAWVRAFYRDMFADTGGATTRRFNGSRGAGSRATWSITPCPLVPDGPSIDQCPHDCPCGPRSGRPGADASNATIIVAGDAHAREGIDNRCAAADRGHAEPHLPEARRIHH